MTLTATTTDDVVDATPEELQMGDSGADGELSLREAILAANANPGSTIHLPAGVYRLSISNDSEDGEDEGLTGDLDILADVSIFGDIAGGTVIDANGVDRVLHVVVPSSEALIGSFPLTTGNGANFAAAATKLNDLDSIRSSFVDGDIVSFAGTQVDGTTFSFSWTPGTNATVGDLLTEINPRLAGALVSLDSEGNLSLAPTTPGADHQLSLTIRATSSSNSRSFPAFGPPTAPNLDVSLLTIRGGRADMGGGLLNDGGHVNLFETTLTGNQANTLGPAYLNNGGFVQFVNSPLVGNTLGSSTNDDPLVLDLANLLWQQRHYFVEAIDEFLINLNVELEQNFQNVLGEINVPALGTKLQEAFVPALEKFSELRTSLGDFLQTVVNIPEPPSDVSFTQVIQGALYAALGAGPSGLADLDPKVKEALESRGLAVQKVGLNLLQDGPDSDAVPSPTDILITLGDDVEGTRWIEYGFHLGQRLVFDIPGFSLDGALSDLIDPEQAELSETVGTILSGLGVSTSGSGLRFDTRWDARLGFGISERVGEDNGSGVYLRGSTTSNGLPNGSTTEELKFSIDVFATPTVQATGFSDQFQDVVTTPNWSTTLSLGVLQARVSDGAPAEIKITAPTGLPLSVVGDLSRVDLSLFTLNFGPDVEKIKFIIETDLAGFESKEIVYDLRLDPFDPDGNSSANPSLLEFVAGLNAAVIVAYGTPLPPVSFTLDFSPIDAFFNPGAVTTPFLVLNARLPEINHLTIKPASDVNNTTILGPEAFNFISGQHEDRRVRGMGFANNSSSKLDADGNQVLSAPLGAPASGISTADPDFFIQVGGERSQDGGDFITPPTASLRIFFPEMFNRHIGSLEQLNDKLNEVLEAELISKGLAPNTVVFELVGDKFQLTAAKPADGDAPLITVTYPSVDQSKFSVVASVDITDPDFNAGYLNNFPNDQRNFNRVTASAIKTAATENKLLELFKPDLFAEGKLRLHVTTDPEDLASTNPNSSPFQSTFLSDVALALPNVEFDFVADVKLDGAEIIKKARKGEKLKFFDVFQIPTLKFDNIQLDVEGFLTNVVAPIAQSAAEALEPLLSVVGNAPDDAAALFNQPIPVISDLLDRNVTLGDILGPDVEDFVTNFAAGLEDLANLGDKIAEFVQSDAFLEAFEGVGKFTFGGIEFVMDPKSPLFFPKTGVPVPTDLQFATGLSDLKAENFMRSFSVVDQFAPPGFNIDLFSPSTIVNMVTGNPFNIVSFGLPQIDAEAGAEFTFQLENFSLDIEALATFDANLRLVYDSLGLEQIVDAARSGADIDWSNLLNGLAIQNNPAGFELGGSVSFIGQGDLTIQDTNPETGETTTVFSADGSIDLEASLGLELLDPNNDGKLRLDEILAITRDFTEPGQLFCLFDIQGSADADGSITVVAGGIEILNKDFSASTGEFSLQSLLTSAFGTCVHTAEPPVLAETVQSGGETILRINTGSFAANRLNGDVTDAEDPASFLVINADGTVDLFDPDGSSRRFDLPDGGGKRLPLKPGALPFNQDGITPRPVVLASGGIEFRDTDGTVLERYAPKNSSGKYLLIKSNGVLDPDTFLREAGGRFEKWIVDGVSGLVLSGSDGDFTLKSSKQIFSSSSTKFNAENKIETVTDWVGAKTKYTYDALGRLKSIEQFDAQGNSLGTTPYFHGVEGLFAKTLGGQIKVWGYGVSESDAQTFDAASISKIVAYGSEFDDLFDYSGIANTPVEVRGLGGNDAIKGGGADDRLDGGSGNDQLFGNQGNDTILAGTGINDISDGAGDDFVDFSRNSARVLFTTDGGSDTVIGSAFDDKIGALSGDLGNVRFVGGFGNDILMGADGDDVLIGGLGNDQLKGEAGNDELSGGSGADDLNGGEGDDDLFGGADADVLDGTSGRDRLFGEGGNDEIIAGIGDIRADGGGGIDHLAYTLTGQNVTLTATAFEHAQGDTPYFDVEALTVNLGAGTSKDPDLIIDGPILPLNVQGGPGSAKDVVEVASLPAVVDPPAIGGLETTIDLGIGDDELTIAKSERPLHVKGGTSATNGDRLLIDREEDFVPRSVTLTPDTITGLGIAELRYENFDFVMLELGTGDDTVAIESTSAGTETLIELGEGDDQAVVESIAGTTIINGNQGTGSDSNSDAGTDTVTVVIAGDPNLLTEDSFGDLSFSMDRLHIDNSQGTADVDWTFDEGMILVGSTEILDTLGAEVTIFTGGGAGVVDDLTVRDDVEVPQLVLVNDRLVRIDEGANVLSYEKTTPFPSFNYDATVDGLDGVIDVAVSPDGRFVYAVGRDDDAVTVFRANGGDLDFVQVLRDGELGVDGLDGASSVAISPDGKFVYVGSSERVIAIFSRVASTGRLVYRGQFVQGFPITHLAMSPDLEGSNLYGTNEQFLFRLSRDKTTGLLSFGETRFIFGTTAYRDIAVGRDGADLFTVSTHTETTGQVSHRLEQWHLGPGGTLPASPVDSKGTTYTAVAAAPNNTVYAVFDGGVDHYRYTASGFGTPTTEAIASDTNKAEGVSVAVDPKLPFVVTSFDTATVDPTPPKFYLEFLFLGNIIRDDLVHSDFKDQNGNPKPGFGGGIVQDEGDTLTIDDEIYIEFDGVELFRRSLAAGTVADLSNAPRIELFLGETHTIGLWEADAPFPDDELDVTTATADAVSEGFANVIIKAITIDGRVTRASEIAVDFQVVQENQATPAIEPLTILTHIPGVGFLGQDDQPIPGVTRLDALAINEFNRHIYGANTKRDLITVNTFDAGFQRTVSDGETQELDASNLNSTDDVRIAFSANGNRSYALSPKFGVLAAYNGGFDNAPDQTIFAGLTAASSLAATPISAANQMVYVTNPSEDSLLVYRDNAGDLKLVQVLTDGVNGVDGLDGATEVIVTSDNGFVHVAGAGEDAIATFRVNSDGTLSFVQKFAHADLDNPTSLTDADSGHLYVTSRDNNAVLVFDRFSNGMLSQRQTIRRMDSGLASLNGPVASVLSSDGQSLYVAAQDTEAILVFDRNEITGVLTLRQVAHQGEAGIRGIAGLTELAVSEDGQFLFAAGTNSMVSFQRDSATGELTILQRIADGSGGFDGLEQVTDLLIRGNTLYVGNGGAIVGSGGVTVLNVAQSIPELNRYLVEYEAMDILTVQTAGKGDIVDADRTATKSFRLVTGGGPDAILLRNTAHFTAIDSGADSDVIDLLRTANASLVTISAGSEDDEVNVFATGRFSRLTINGDNGDDRFTVKGARLESDVIVNGNDHPDGDTLRFDGHGFKVNPVDPQPDSGTIVIDDANFPGTAHPVNYNTVEFLEIIASPLADAGGPYTISEGDAVSFNATATRIPAGHTVESYEWGVGERFGVVTGVAPTLSWNELREFGITDDGISTIWVTVTSRLNGELFRDTAVATLQVNNTDPTIAADGTGFVEAGAPYLLNLSASDPGDDRIHTWLVNWGDGSPVEAYGGDAATVTHTYLVDREYKISIGAFDEDGGPYGLAHFVDVAPSRNISGFETGVEGSPYTLSLNNPALALIESWTINWGDGTMETIPAPRKMKDGVEVLVPRPIQLVAHTYAENGAYRITVSTSDADGTTRRNILPIDMRIENANPFITLVQAAESVDQGTVWVLNVDAADPGVLDVLTYEFDLDGDGVYERTSPDGQASQIFRLPGERIVRVRVRDDDGGVSEPEILTLNVDNVGPTIDNVTVLTENPSEATAVLISVSASDPGGPLDPLTYAFDFDNDGMFELVGRTNIGRHVFPDDGSYSVGIRVTDSYGASAEAMLEIVVINLPPAITRPFAGLPVEEGRGFTVTVPATDPAGDYDPLTYEFDFDADGSYDVASANPSVSHMFPDDGIYTIGIRVSDGDGGEVETTLDVEVKNVAPVIELAGASETAEGETYTLVLGDVIDPGDDTVTEYIVRWGDGTEDTYTTNGPVTHVYHNTVGEKTIRVLLVDEDGTHPLAGEHRVLVTGASVVNRTLFLVGGDADDLVTVHAVGNSILRIHATFFPSDHGREYRDFDLAQFDRIVMYLNGGDDHATIAGNVQLPVIIDGGKGDDHLNGGQSPSALIGSGGDDLLIGGSGNDLLIGGAGSDRLIGRDGADILIAGRSAYDDDFAQWRALDAILSEWNSTKPLGERVENLRNGTGPILSLSGAKLSAGETIFDDNDEDRITANAADWIFANVSQDVIGGSLHRLFDEI